MLGMIQEQQGKPFDVDKLDVFKRQGAKVNRRDKPRPGVMVNLANGYSVSVYFEGDGETAEIAVFEPGPHNDLVRFMDGEIVQFGCSMERVQRIIDLASVDALMRPYQPPTPPIEMRADG